MPRGLVAVFPCTLYASERFVGGSSGGSSQSAIPAACHWLKLGWRCWLQRSRKTPPSSLIDRRQSSSPGSYVHMPAIVVHVLSEAEHINKARSAEMVDGESGRRMK